MQNSSLSLMSAVVAGVILFLLGVAWTRMKSANGAYKTIKNGVKPARKLYWISVGGVVKIGFWVLVLLTFLVFWQVRDIQDSDGRDPVVPAEVRPSTR
jgi:ABC-type Fe3+ transport system permease subunit